MKTLPISREQPFTWLEFQMDDYEHFKNAVESWELDFLQMDSSDFYAYFRQLILPSIQVGHCQLNGHIEQTGVVPEEMWTFVIPHKNSSLATYNLVEAKSNAMILIYPPGMQFSSTTYDGWEIYTFSIEEKYFKEVATTLGLVEIENKLSEVERVYIDPDQVKKLQDQLENVLKYAAILENKIFDTEELQILFYLLPTMLIKNLHTHMECNRDILLKEKYLLYVQARSYIHTHIHEDITVKSVAQNVNITERTLHNYFQNELNISPKRYLMVLRLTKINKILKKSRLKKGLVEETARKFGFYHMGQFAKSYKDFFGELPSATLRQI